MRRLKFAAIAHVALDFVAAQLSLSQSAAFEAETYRPKRAAQLAPFRVEVIDGTSFRDIETKAVFRLYGIETCSVGQMASLDRQSWPCDVVATAWLVTATLNKWLVCATIREAKGEHLSRCVTSDHADLAADMLRAGLAVKAPLMSGDPMIDAYARAEQQARKTYQGLWSSTFEMPWIWRATHGGQGKAPGSGPVTP